MKPYLHAKFEVSLLQPDPEEEEKEEHEKFGKIAFMNNTHILHQITSKFLIGVNFYGDLHLDVSRC